MAELTVLPIQKAGRVDMDAILVAAAAGGDSVPASSGIFIVMQNDDASAHTLTIAAPVATKDCGNLGALGVDAIALVVAAGKVGLLTVPAGYADASGNFTWTYDAETSVKVGAFSLAP